MTSMRPDFAPEITEHGGRTVRLSAVIDTPVYMSAGKPVGECHDVWATPSGPALGEFGPALRIHSIVIGRGAFGERLGYHHGDLTAPWLLRVLFERLHRAAAVVAWPDVAAVEPGAVRLRPHATLGSLDDFDRDHTDDGVFLGLRLLDTQIVDAQGRMAGVADDLELAVRTRGNVAPHATAILTGPGALAHRIGGRLGLWIESVHRRLHIENEPAPATIPFDVVRSIDNHVQLAVPRSELGITGLEEWARDRVIAKIPGGRG